MSADPLHGKTVPPKASLQKSFRFLNRSLEAFYEQQYEQAVEFCRNSLALLLPSPAERERSPEEEGDLFLKTFSALLPVGDAEGVMTVFTISQRHREKFRIPPGEPLPHRDWWRLLKISKSEAEPVVATTRNVLNTLKEYYENGE